MAAISCIIEFNRRWNRNFSEMTTAVMLC